MVGSAKMRDLLAVAQEKQARVVLVGDSRQLAPIEAGGAFRVLEHEIGSRSLAEIRRQTIGWQRDAVKAFAEKSVGATGASGLKIVSLPAREDDPKKRCPDITRARTELSWEPKVDLNEGLERTFGHFRMFVNSAR